MSDAAVPTMMFVLRLDASPALLAAIAPIAAVLSTLLRVKAKPAEPVARAPKPRPEVVKRAAGEWITAERDALLRDLWPTMMPSRDIREQLAALPGGDFTPSIVASRAAYLNLRRPVELLPKYMAAGKKRVPGGAPTVKGTAPPVAPDQSAEANGPVKAGVGERTAPPAVESLAEPVKVAPARVVSQFPDQTPQAPREPLERESADKAQILSFCEGRGMRFETFDIDVVNKRLAKLGHPGFTLIDTPPRARRA